jgi:hypothetical protein
MVARDASEARLRRVRWSHGETEVLELGAGPRLLLGRGGGTAFGDVVVRDYESNGTSAMTTVPARAGLVTRRAPPSASTRSARQRRPVLAASFSPPTPSSAISIANSSRRARQADRGGGRPGVRGDVRQCLAGHEVASQLDLLRQPLWRVAEHGRRHRERLASHWSAESRPCSSTAGWIPRASSRSSSSDCASCSLAPCRSARPPSRDRGGCPPGSRAWRGAAATSRCCAPSCKLRSSRRRSASPAATIRCRDACNSARSACDSM